MRPGPAIETPLSRNGASHDHALRFSHDDRVMILAPHPDDESLATGGLIQHARQAGAAIRVLYMTDGDDNPWAQLAAEGRWPRTAADRGRWGARRRLEALAALDRLGVPAESARFLGFHDQALTALLLWHDPRPISALRSELARWSPTIVVTPSPLDHHPDHSATAVLLRLAQLGLDRALPVILRYSIHAHRGGIVRPRHVHLRPTERASKRRAILCHESQLRWRRFQLPAFARAIEAFDISTPAAMDDGHSLRTAFVACRVLHVMIERPASPRLGAPVMRLVLAGDGARRLGLSVRLSNRSAMVELTDVAAQRVHGAARLRVAPRSWAVAIPLDRTYSECFTKVEWPLEQRLGLLDHDGWRSVRMPSRRIREKAGGSGASRRTSESLNGSALVAVVRP